MAPANNIRRFVARSGRFADELRSAGPMATSPRRRRSTKEDGSVTAEAAVVLPVIAAFALALVWMLSVGIAKVETVDAARDAARAIARGDDPAQAVATAARTAPPNSDISIDYTAGVVTVTVSAEVQPPGWLLAPLPAVSIGSQASTLLEGEQP